jgi:acyl dehydratase
VFKQEAEMTGQYLEDFAVGQRFSTGRHIVDDQQIKEFAAEFDPQPFHVDDTAAAKSIFRGLAASGWHTAAITMKLLVQSDFRPAGGIIGLGLEDMQWPKPVRAGDELHVETEVLQVRPSSSKPGQGVLKVRNTTFNQKGEAVLSQTVNLLLLRRPGDSGDE